MYSSWQRTRQSRLSGRETKEKNGCKAGQDRPRYRSSFVPSVEDGAPKTRLFLHGASAAKRGDHVSFLLVC